MVRYLLLSVEHKPGLGEEQAYGEVICLDLDDPADPGQNCLAGPEQDCLAGPEQECFVDPESGWVADS